MDEREIRRVFELAGPTQEQKERLLRQIEEKEGTKPVRRIRRFRYTATAAAVAAIVVFCGAGLNAASGGAVVEKIRQVFTIDQGRQDVAGQAERVYERGVEVYAPAIAWADDGTFGFVTKRGVLVYDREAGRLMGTIDLQKIGCIYVDADTKQTHILKQGDELILFNSEKGKAEAVSWHFSMKDQSGSEWTGTRETDQKASDAYMKACEQQQKQYADTFDQAKEVMGGLGPEGTDPNEDGLLYSEKSLVWTDRSGETCISYLTIGSDGGYAFNTWNEGQKKTVAQTLSLSTEDAGEETEKTVVLPEFVYTGEDPAIEALLLYQREEDRKRFDEEGTIWIPTPVIYKRIEKGNEIILFGNFGTDEYKLNGKILESVAGSRCAGCAHIRKTGSVYEVTDLIYAADGSDYDESIRGFTKGYPGVYELYNRDYEKKEKQTRMEYLKMYVNGNRLNITHYQDYGWDPVKIR